MADWIIVLYRDNGTAYVAGDTYDYDRATRHIADSRNGGYVLDNRPALTQAGHPGLTYSHAAALLHD